MTDHPSSVKYFFYFCNFSIDVLHVKALYLTSMGFMGKSLHCGWFKNRTVMR